MEAINTGKQNGVRLDLYNDTYSLVSCRESNDGQKFFDQWAKYHKTKDSYQDKDWPVKVVLGSKETATAVLLMLLKEITGNDYTDNKDVPF